MRHPILIRLQHVWAALIGDLQKARSIEREILMSQLSDAFTAAQTAVADLQNAVAAAKTYTDTLKADSADALTVASGLSTLTDNLTSATATLTAISAPAAEAAPAPSGTAYSTAGLPTA